MFEKFFLCFFFFLGDMFVVSEGGSAPITTSHLKASDEDTELEQLVVSLVSPPQFGYIENVLPSPGFEKSNMGISIGEDFIINVFFLSYESNRHLISCVFFFSVQLRFHTKTSLTAT